MKAGAGAAVSWSSYVRAFMTLTAIAFAQAIPARAQGLQEQTAIMVAFVTDSAGKPVPGAEVQIVGTSLRGNTDDDPPRVLSAFSTHLHPLADRILSGPRSTRHRLVDHSDLEGAFSVLPR